MDRSYKEDIPSMRIGVDLGGTKIEFIVLGSDRRELHKDRIPTPRGDYDGTVRAIKEGVEQIERGLRRRGRECVSLGKLIYLVVAWL